MKLAHNKNLELQINLLEEILAQNKIVKKVLRLAPKLGLPNWYLGSGCVAQTIWNALHDFELTKGIKDCDLVFYDSSDVSSEAQDTHIQQGKEVFKDIPIPVEIVNQARVHLWYENEFGRKIKPYKSVEEAINEWPTTATGIGVRHNENSKFIVYAPYGLNDLFGLVLRPNKLKITEDIYLEKIKRWTKIWYKLKVIPWNS